MNESGVCKEQRTIKKLPGIGVLAYEFELEDQERQHAWSHIHGVLLRTDLRPRRNRNRAKERPWLDFLCPQFVA